ncbi:MAG: hypothetical protein H0V27_12430 [Pyrinomonadaceae bacterium]|nr:hypothetical protein [Pyrinomonadaceae bacterium]
MSKQQIMIDVPRQTLREIVAKYGRSVCENPKRCKALLRDYCGTHRREINVLIAALEERVGEELLAAGAGRSTTPREVLLSRLTKRLENHLALTEGAARWAVDSWAVALGVLSEAEAEARAQNEAENDQRKLETSAARSPKSVVAEDDDDREDTVAQRLLRQKPSAQTKQPPAPPAPTRPTNKNPIIVAPPSPAPVLVAPPQQVHVSKSRGATVPASQPDPQSRLPVDSLPRRRRKGKLRGCLFGCLLFVILSLLGVFVAPFIVTVLREEQQQQQPTIEQPRSP